MLQCVYIGYIGSWILSSLHILCTLAETKIKFTKLNPTIDIAIVPLYTEAAVVSLAASKLVMGDTGKFETLQYRYDIKDFKQY